MPLYEYRCTSCDETREALVPLARASRPSPCPCGGEQKRVYSTFAIKQYAVDHSTWSLVAPERDGKPMTEREAAKVLDRYLPGEQEREQSYRKQLNETKAAYLKEQSKREAWAERRVTIGH